MATLCKFCGKEIKTKFSVQRNYCTACHERRRTDSIKRTLLVRKILIETRTHLSVAKIHDELGKRLERQWNIKSVYRDLRVLEDIGECITEKSIPHPYLERIVAGYKIGE